MNITSNLDVINSKGCVSSLSRFFSRPIDSSNQVVEGSANIPISALNKSGILLIYGKIYTGTIIITLMKDTNIINEFTVQSTGGEDLTVSAEPRDEFESFNILKIAPESTASFYLNIFF